MMLSDEDKKKYSCGSLLKKRSCGGRTIKVESLDIYTAERINKRVSRSAKQHFTEVQNSKRIADETYSD